MNSETTTRPVMKLAAVRMGMFPLDNTVDCIAEDAGVHVMVSLAPTVGFDSSRPDHIFWPFTASTHEKDNLTTEYLGDFLMATLGVLNFQYVVALCSHPDDKGNPDLVIALDRDSITPIKDDYQIYGTYGMRASPDALKRILELTAHGGVAAMVLADLHGISLPDALKQGTAETAVPDDVTKH